MLRIHAAHRAEALAEVLAEVLSEAPADSLAPEWIAVPSVGVRRWLSLELARYLGTAGSGQADGIAANIIYALPGSLRNQVLDAARSEDEPDPWCVPRLVWSVLQALDAGEGDPRLGPVVEVRPGGSRYARARRIADLFDRYHLHRPAMVRAWAGATTDQDRLRGFGCVPGEAPTDVDGTGQPLAEHHRWQPHLWRSVRATIDRASPAELLPGLLAQVADGSLGLALPDRLSLFGLSVLPGGSCFVELATSVAAQRDVHLFLLDPSPATTDRVRALARSGPMVVGAPRLRVDDHSAEVVAHPLLRSWGRLPRETAVLLGEAEASASFPPPSRVVDDADPSRGTDPDEANDKDDGDYQDMGAGQDGAGVAGSTLLGRIQHDLRSGQAPRPTHRLDPGDRSMQFHAAHGPLRQVEVARDALLHLLADDPTLREDEVLVICPALDRFEPLIELGFGPSSDRRGRLDEHVGAADVLRAPILRYRVADRSLRSANPLAVALVDVVDAAVGRFTAPAVLDLLALPPLRRRFAFTDEDLSQATTWVAQTNVRWGLDGSTRAAFGVPGSVTANTWGAALDRLLLGAAIFGDDAFAVGGAVPYGIEGDRVELAGRLAEVVARLGDLAEAGEHPRPIAEWVALLRTTADALLAPERDEVWQAEALDTVLVKVIEDAGAAGSDPFLLTATDVRRLLADQLTDAADRPDFMRGGITVTSANSLRRVPYRVVCLLGLDQGAFAPAATDGDDLVAAQQMVGDPERRSEGREGVLDAVLSAGEHLIVVRNGHDLRTNQEIPPPVVVAELQDLITATLAPRQSLAQGGPDIGDADTGAQLEVHHPRQAFDERCLTDSALLAGGPWSFDPASLAGARARRNRQRTLPPFLAARLPEEPMPIVELADLHAVLQNPVQTFLRQRLQLRLPEADEALPTRLPVDLGPLEKWHVGARLLTALLDGGDLAQQARLEEAVGAVPPGSIGQAKLAKLTEEATELADDAVRLGLRPGRPDAIPIAVELTDRTRIVGTVAGRLAGPEAGPLRVTYSKMKPKYHLAAWLDLLVLVATDPERRWRSVAVHREDGRDGGRRELVIAGDTAEAQRSNALAGLEVVVDLLRRARREPLPLFAVLSPKLHTGTHKRDQWEGRAGQKFGADRMDRYNKLAFDGYSYREILSLASMPDDPPGSGDRARRYAAYLWSTVGRTAIDRCTDGKLPDEDASSDSPMSAASQQS